MIPQVVQGFLYHMVMNKTSDIAFRVQSSHQRVLNVEKQPSNLAEAQERQKQELHLNLVNDSYEIVERLAAQAKDLDGSSTDLNDREGVVVVNETYTRSGGRIAERRSVVLQYEPNSGETISLEASVARGEVSVPQKSASTILYHPQSDELLNFGSYTGAEGATLTVQKDGDNDFRSQLSTQFIEHTDAGYYLMTNWI